MPLSPHNQEMQGPAPGLDLLQEGQEGDSAALFLRDAGLLEELKVKNETLKHPSAETGLQFANAELADMARAAYDAPSLAGLETFLSQKGTLTIPVSSGHVVPVD